MLTAAVVVISYWVGLPYWWQRDPYIATFLVIFGNWLLLNIIFHYYMGVATPPGYPPNVRTLTIFYYFSTKYFVLLIVFHLTGLNGITSS